jgi:hypothetical protein
MEVVIDYECLKGINGEDVIKEVSLAIRHALNTFHFASPYKMVAHGDTEKGINWADGHIPFYQLFNVLNELVAGYTHIYAYWRDKCSDLSGLLGRTVINLEEFGCTLSEYLRPKFHRFVPCHKFANIHCATRHAYEYYEWLLYHFQTKLMVRCPDEKTRHIAMFLSAV